MSSNFTSTPEYKSAASLALSMLVRASELNGTLSGQIGINAEV